MISNPCAWFENGNKRRAFTYEGGSKLFNFSPYDSGLSTSMEMNLLFHADDEAHAEGVLERMIQFALETTKRYEQSCGTASNWANRYRVGRYTKLLANKDKWVFTEVGDTQMFLVGWAENETI